VLKALWKRKAKHEPRIPDGVRIYAVGDIHGRADLLNDLMARIQDDIRDDRPARPVLVFLGDYVDRGPDSREVLGLLLAHSESMEMVALKGNHEAMILEFLKKPTALEEWRQFGGIETLVSYGLIPPLKPDARAQIALSAALNRLVPEYQRRWLETLPTSWALGDFFFVHAGVRPGVPLGSQREEDLLWIREDFLLHEGDFGKMIVHGHTPVSQPDFRPNRINIDTGAYATGRLTCLRLEGNEVRLF
jgi:serine/threonine protein phosphatase 1